MLRGSMKVVEGGLYVTPHGDNYIPLKVLKLDDHGVHVRTYSNVLSAIPPNIDESTLYMAGIYDKTDGEPLGNGHIPVSHESFSSWCVAFVQLSSVSPDELEGYDYWLEAEGGYF